MSTLLTTPANASAFSPLAAETVTLVDYVSGSPSVTFVRAPGASVAPTATWTGGVTSFPATTTVLKATVQCSWNTSLGGRIRTEKTETIISNGTKK
ncbi:MAG: hypothetical protein M3Z64_08940 [Verrucomicrobiota bacterium]|nr:hypothetical protein [Verrucomicrobiota bacterium]